MQDLNLLDETGTHGSIKQQSKFHLSRIKVTHTVKTDIWKQRNIELFSKYDHSNCAYNG